MVADDWEWTRAQLVRLAECPAESLPLGDWYAGPLSPEAAAAVGAGARVALRAACCERRDTAPARLAGLVAAFWLGGNARDEYRSLSASLRGSRMGALLELVWGQLLASRRLHGAHARLRAGFERAVPWFGAAEYFRVMRRHRLLEALALGEAPAPGRSLPDLLCEAQVIVRLDGARPPRRALADAALDTVG